MQGQLFMRDMALQIYRYYATVYQSSLFKRSERIQPPYNQQLGNFQHGAF